MPKTLFLFDGGNYKRLTDDGRLRVPLTPQEAENIHYDPEIPGDAGSSIGTEFNMKKWASHLCNLRAGDELFIGLVPDAVFVRGMFMMSFDVAPGFTAVLDLVSVADVYAAYLAGDASNVAAFNTGPDQLTYDFADGLGNATKDAHDIADLYAGFGDVPSDHRNNAAAVAKPWAVTKFAGLGEALYFRLTITAITVNLDGTGCCATCSETNMPTFQVGAVYDRLCLDKQRVRKYCNCPVDLCNEECPAVPPNVVINAILTDNVSDGTVALTVDFDQGVTGFDETDVTTLIAGAVVGGTIAFANIVIVNTSSYIVNYLVGYGDNSGGTIDFTVAADSAIGIVGGLGNTISNTSQVIIPGA